MLEFYSDIPTIIEKDFDGYCMLDGDFIEILYSEEKVISKDEYNSYNLAILSNLRKGKGVNWLYFNKSGQLNSSNTFAKDGNFDYIINIEKYYSKKYKNKYKICKYYTDYIYSYSHCGCVIPEESYYEQNLSDDGSEFISKRNIYRYREI